LLLAILYNSVIVSGVMRSEDVGREQGPIENATNPLFSLLPLLLPAAG
jgi:hypothetical protein